MAHRAQHAVIGRGQRFSELGGEKVTLRASAGRGAARQGAQRRPKLAAETLLHDVAHEKWLAESVFRWWYHNAV